MLLAGEKNSHNMAAFVQNSNRQTNVEENILPCTTAEAPDNL
jgi:hypothetical protein